MYAAPHARLPACLHPSMFMLSAALLLQDAPVAAAVAELKACKARVEELKKKLEEQAAEEDTEYDETKLFDDE